MFNLASADRLALLRDIATTRKNLTALSKTINTSRPECSRHLDRLKLSGLISKDSEGFYQTTSVGDAILKVLPSVQFLLQYREDLMSHDLSGLPVSFVERLGDLQNAEHVRHFSQATTVLLLTEVQNAVRRNSLALSEIFEPLRDPYLVSLENA